MEFFERAHVVKTNKATENVKKQLKQMLHGYKLSDNKLIQNSAESKIDYDDSTSVSGFSDLNLTNSSCEDNVTDGNKSLNEESSFTENKDDLSSNIVSHDKDLDSISDEKGNTTISSEDKESELHGESEVDVSSKSESDESLASALLDSDVQSDSSEFDKNGELAFRIHQRLEQLKLKKPTQKRKYKEISPSDEERQKPSSKEKYREQEVSEDISEQDSRSVCSIENIIVSSEVVESDPSPPFVSITAVDMLHQRLDDIIGDYKYSTIRNLPSDNQHTILSTNNSGFFTEEIMHVDINTEDEIGSLIPELDDIPTIEEIDEEVINLDTTVDTNVNESVIDLENTESASTSETEHFIDPQINVEETFKIYYTNMGCIIVLKHPSELYIQGKVKIKRLGGTVEVFGYTLKDEFCDLYAPYYHFAQSVKTAENPNTYFGLFMKLTASGMSCREAEHIVTSIGDHDAVILLQSLQSEKIEFIEDNFKVTYLFVKLNKVIEPYFKSASDILKCSLYSIRPLNTFRIHPSWSEALLYSECPASRGIVCGGKGAGKSTYLRYQVNKLLANGPVLIVDLDPGQCEFTVAGNVSASVVTSPLLGPNFTHLKKPEIMLNIGMINTMENSKRYLSAVHTLITQCRENEAFANMPWVINTMGMTTALGLKFITYIILVTKPTYVLQYESKKSKKCFNTLLQPRNVNTLYEEFKKSHLFKNISFPDDLNYSLVVAYDTDESLKDSFSLTPKDERYLNFLAYFSQLASIQKNLLAITPYQVSLKALYIGTNVVVKADDIARVINGKLVALCQQKQCDNERVFTLADKPLLCHGHGLIRGIDWEKEILYVITPVLSRELCGVNTLVYADWAPDLVGQENHLPEGTVVPYRTRTQEQLKQLMSTPRRRFNPLQLLKITRSAKIESLVN